MKKEYLESRGRNDKNAIGEFLSAMGHNVANAVMTGRTKDYEETRSLGSQKKYDNHETSKWVQEFENSVLEELENNDSDYPQRKIGVKEKVQWKKKKCPSCNLGFNKRSSSLNIELELEGGYYYTDRS